MQAATHALKSTLEASDAHGLKLALQEAKAYHAAQQKASLHARKPEATASKASKAASRDVSESDGKADEAPLEALLRQCETAERFNDVLLLLVGDAAPVRTAEAGFDHTLAPLPDVVTLPTVVRAFDEFMAAMVSYCSGRPCAAIEAHQPGPYQRVLESFSTCGPSWTGWWASQLHEWLPTPISPRLPRR